MKKQVHGRVCLVHYPKTFSGVDTVTLGWLVNRNIAPTGWASAELTPSRESLIQPCPLSSSTACTLCWGDCTTEALGQNICCQNICFSWTFSHRPSADTGLSIPKWASIWASSNSLRGANFNLFSPEDQCPQRHNSFRLGPRRRTFVSYPTVIHH